MPRDLLSDLARLEGDIAGVRNEIDRVLAERRNPEMRRRVGDALGDVEVATERWLSRTHDLEARLVHHALVDSDDTNAVVARLGAMALLHTAVASDLALLSWMDQAAVSARIGGERDARLPQHAETIQDAAFGEGRLIWALSTPDDDSTGNQEVEPVRDRDVDDVVHDLVERAGRCGTAVLGGLAGGLGDLAFAALSPELRLAASVAPDDLRTAVRGIAGHIGRLVGRILTRIDAIWSIVLGSYRPAIDAVIDEVDPASLVVETLAGKVVGRIMRADQVRTIAAVALQGAPDQADRIRGIRGLTKKHCRWVGPVRVLARGIPHLWSVPVGPLPAAPVAAVGLLAWTFLVTGDQLDAPGRYPRLWTGVIGYAQGYR